MPQSVTRNAAPSASCAPAASAQNRPWPPALAAAALAGARSPGRTEDSSDSRRIAVRAAGQSIEALTGQILFDLDTSELAGVQSMPPQPPLGGPPTLLGCAGFPDRKSTRLNS